MARMVPSPYGYELFRDALLQHLTLDRDDRLRRACCRNNVFQTSKGKLLSPMVCDV